MAGPDYTTAALLNAVKRRGGFAESQQTFRDADLVEMANDRLQSYLFPKIVEQNSGLFVAFEDFTFTSANAYDIPSAAMGTKLKDVVLIDTEGNETDIHQTTHKKVCFDTSRQLSFYLRGNKIVFYPQPTVGDQFRIYYYKRPNELVVRSAAIQVGSISDTTITAGGDSSTIPSSWSTANTFCVVKGTPNFDLVLNGLTASLVSNPTITLSSVEDVAVNDWVALDGETPIPQIPFEAFSWLAQALLVEVLQSWNDPAIQIHENKLARLENDLLSMLTPRVSDEPQKIVNRNLIIRYI